MAHTGAPNFLKYIAPAVSTSHNDTEQLLTESMQIPETGKTKGHS